MKNISEAKYQKTIYVIYEIFDHFCDDGPALISHMTERECKEHLSALKLMAFMMVLRNLFQVPGSLWKMIIFGC